MTATRRRLLPLLAVLSLAVALFAGAPPTLADDAPASVATSAAAPATGGTITPFAGQVEVPAGTTMTTDLQMVAGAVHVNGTLQGSVSLAAGQVAVGPQGVITGSVTLGVGQVTVQPGGRIEGPVTVGGSSVQSLQCPAAQAPACTVASGASGWARAQPIPATGWKLPFYPDVRGLLAWSPWLHTAFHLLSWLGLLALSLPVAALFPRAVGNVVRQMEGEAGRTALIGLCAMVLALPALVVVTITIIGIPVALAAALGLVVAWFFGYVGVVFLVGRQTLRLGGVALPNPLLAVAVGSALVALAEWVPILGGLVWLAVSCLGLGAVLLTRFGTGSQWPRGGAGGTPETQPPA